ncbi:MAG: carboxypeptidase regulatory-like domain-containing protein [Sediminibacterium sp.]
MFSRFIKFLFFSLIFSLQKIEAQSIAVSGLVIDSLSGKIVEYATVTVYKASDTTVLSYCLTDSKGNFEFPFLQSNLQMRILVSATGYQFYRTNLLFNKNMKNINLGLIKLKPSFNDLKEVVVVAEIPPVIIRKDTIEFNAASFKTLPTALVEDLLKKLPGVYVSDDGSILVNGQKVNRILVDGKQFFGNNYQMATKNLPANLIDKVQVLDDKESFEFRPGSNETPLNKVINLTFKKGVKKGWFGKAYAGLGTNDRNEQGGILNLFKDTLQLSLIGYNNNLNRSSFSLQDMIGAGGFNRSGAGSLTINRGLSGEKFLINGISFGGGTTGVNRSNGLGWNLNHAPSKDLSFYLQYFYSQNRNNLLSNTIATFPISNGVNTNNNSSDIIDNHHSHHIKAGLNWKIDSLSRMQISVQYQNQKSISQNNLLQQMINEKTGILIQNTGDIISVDAANNFSYNINYSHRFSKTKKNLSFSHYLNKSTSSLNQINESVNSLFFPSPSFSLFEQKRNTITPLSSYGFISSFWNQFSKHFSYSFDSKYENNISGKQIQTLLKSQNGILYDSIVIPQSNDLNRQLSMVTNGLSIVYSKNKFRFRYTVDYLHQWINDDYKGFNNNQSKASFSNILFRASITLNRVNIQYAETVQPPAIQDLIPVPDNSNPLIIFKGNAGLKPYKSRALNTSGSIANSKNGGSLFFVTNSSFTSNSIINRLEIDSSGRQLFTPENIDFTSNHVISLNYDQKFKRQNGFSFGFSIFLTAGYNFTPVLLNQSVFHRHIFSQGFNLSFNFNWNDKVDFSPRYRLGAGQNRGNVNNSLINNQSILEHDLSGAFTYRINSSLVFTTSYKIVNQLNVSSNLNNSFFTTNADLTYSFLNNKRGHIKLFLNDVFNTNKGIQNSMFGNYTTFTNVNILNRYFLFSFNYDIRDWVKRKNVKEEFSKYIRY